MALPTNPASTSAFHRRAFLTAAAFAAAAPVAAAFAGRTFIQTQDKSGLKSPVLGPDGLKYECVHDWLTPPSGLQWGDTHGLAQDSAGRIYVAHTVNGQSSRAEAVVVFSPTGTFETAWGAAFRGGAHGLDVRTEKGIEFLYHCDTNRRLVVKTDLKGEVLWEAGYPEKSGKYAAKEKYCPTNVAFLPDGPSGEPGDILVGDGYGSSFIHRYSPKGDYVKTIIGPGSAKGEVSCPHGLWVDDRAGKDKLTLLVADRGNRRIQRFTLDGEHIEFVATGKGAGEKGADVPSPIRMPCHFKTRSGMLLVPDLESVITLLDRDGKAIAHLGDGAENGKPSGLRDAKREAFLPGKFIHPHTAIFLANGDILVAEWVPIGRITLLRKV